jgi:UMF1 family MFS transporter
MLFLILPSDSPIWYICACFALVANVSFGASVVAMNSYLPSLAKESPEVELLRGEGDDENDVVDDSHDHPLSLENSVSLDGENPEEPLIARQPTTAADEPTRKKEYDALLSSATSRISSLGIAMGYAAGIMLLILALIPVSKLSGSTFSLRLAIGLSGVWWAVFSIPAAVWLPGAGEVKESGRDDGWNEVGAEREEEWRFWREICKAWVRLGNMLRWTEIVKLRNTFKYLAAWFLLSDGSLFFFFPFLPYLVLNLLLIGFTTITSTAVLFAKTALHMPASSLILIGVLAPTSGILGSLVWPRIQRRFSLSNLSILIILVLLASLIPLYGCLGFLVQKSSSIRFGGLTTPGEMFGLAVIFGSVYGAFQGYARAFYAELIPSGEEARWYGLFSITDKSSSFLGPLVVGLIGDLTGNIRYAFWFLVVMIWVAVPVLVSVDVERGRKDAREYVYRGD